MQLQDDRRLKIGELPDLKIVPIDDILFHEEPDNERSNSLMIYLQKEARLKNPPIVGYYNGTSRLILLDGANRVTALKKLEIKDVLVQRIDLFDEDLLFLHWHHAVEKFSKTDFLNKLFLIPQISIEQESSDMIDFTDNGDLLSKIQFHDGQIYKITAEGDLFEKVKLLKEITDVYRGFSYMDRVSYTNLSHLRRHYPDFCAVVCFKKISKDDLIQIVEKNMFLPSGITRIILPKRALRLNVPLDILRFDAPIDEKNHWLQQRITLQVQDKSIRFYYEPTFLFDE
ncbi:hypothetical protein JXB12_08790 [candidate division KSB1 bacterium]|nr:hypothetical protein [candidate division KSB1 bacterium]